MLNAEHQTLRLEGIPPPNAEGYAVLQRMLYDLAIFVSTSLVIDDADILSLL